MKLARVRYRDLPRTPTAPTRPGLGVSRKAPLSIRIDAVLENRRRWREREPWRFTVPLPDRQWTYDTLCWLHDSGVAGHG